MGPREGLELSIRRKGATDEHGGTDRRRGRSGRHKLAAVGVPRRRAEAYQGKHRAGDPPKRSRKAGVLS